MHAETLRDEWTVKLPFAGYSVGKLELKAQNLKGQSPSEFSVLTFKFFDKIVWDDPDFARYASYVAASHRALPRRSAAGREGGDPRQTSLPVVIGAGSHPFPFRTRKLSLLPPMVLHGKLCGRVGRCRHFSGKPASFGSRAFVCTETVSPHTVSHAAWALFLGPPRMPGGGVEEQVAARIFQEAREFWLAGFCLYRNRQAA